MARGIQDIANNLGYVYMTELDGSTIIGIQPNTSTGVRNMRGTGTVLAPFAAKRAAYGILEVTTAAATGNVTSVSVNGVNQIGSAIPIVSASNEAAAALIAAAINNFTPASGPDCVASVNGAFVYIFTPPSFGAASNGYVVDYSATGGALVATATAMAYGSGEGGVYDSVIGRRFFLNADYDLNGVSGGLPADPDNLTNAIEVTEYLVTRGFQTGVGTLEVTVATDALPTVERFCAVTQLITTNQGGAATDNLEYINPSKFVEGDIVFIRSTASGQVLTIIDAVNASVNPTPNIYLTDSSNFIIQANKVLMLRYTFSNSLGGIFVEMSRSVTGGVIPITLLGFATLAVGNTLSAGSTYYITDLGDYGVFTQAISSSQYATTAQYIRRVPKGYASCWRADMTAPTLGLTYRYYQNVYTSVTGAIGTAPDADTTNWAVVSKTDNASYESQINEVGLNTVGNLGTWPFLWEKDQKGNHVAQSQYSFAIVLGVNCFDIFKWTDATIPNVSGNVVIDSRFDCANSDGAVYDNFLVGASKFYNNSLRTGSVVSGNTLIAGGTVLDNYADFIISNFINGGGAAIDSNGGAGAYFYQIANNTINGGSINNNTRSANGTQSIEWCTLHLGGEIKTNSFAATSKIRYAKIGTSSSILNSTLLDPLFFSGSNIENVEVNNSGLLTVIDTGGGGVKDSYFNGGTHTIRPVSQPVTNVTLEGGTNDLTIGADFSKTRFINCTITATVSGTGATVDGIATTGTPTFTFAGDVINTLSSSMVGELDLDDAGVFAANTLTIGSDLQLCGEFVIIGTGAKNITDIVGLPAFNQGCRFWNASFGVCAATFTKVVPGSWTGTKIVGAANFVLEQDAAGPSDYMVITKFGGGVNTITAAVKLA